MSINRVIAKVLLPVPLDKTFDYVLPHSVLRDIISPVDDIANLPQSLENPLTQPLVFDGKMAVDLNGFDYNILGKKLLGRIVRVTFGRSTKLGIIQSVFIEDKSGKGGDTKGFNLKDVEEIYDLPAISCKMMDFIKRVSVYNCIALGSVVKSAISSQKLNSQDTLSITKNDKIEKKFDDYILKEHCNVNLHNLSKEQEECASSLIEAAKSGFNCTVLEGVTGSGKTEVYLKVIYDVIKSGGQILVLLPEIILTTQLIERFKERFGFSPITWHSDMPAAYKRDAWQAIAHNRLQFIVGARSALFLPFSNLKLIVVDEEHDSSFKQDEGMIYHARDMAVLRGKIEGIQVILSSATPSLETIHNTKIGKYDHIKLTSRFGRGAMPDVKVVSVAEEKEKSSSKSGAIDSEIENKDGEEKAGVKKWGHITPTLRSYMLDTWKNDKQTLLFINRRGYAPVLMCKECNHQLECNNCSSNLSMHKRKKILMCHHCEFRMSIDLNCKECGGEDTIISLGAGVDRIAEEVYSFMPYAKVVVLSTDTVDGRKSAAKSIEMVQKGHVDVLIGTQMIAKGLHFSGLHLVGIIDADSSLYGGDIRTLEKSYQLLHQVSGRAGREGDKGMVLFQTKERGGSLLSYLESGDIDGFIAAELDDRKKAYMPPFSRLAIVTLISSNEPSCLKKAMELSSFIPHVEGVQILGPAPSPIFVLRRRYRYRFVIKADKNIAVQRVIQEWIRKVKLTGDIQIKVDIDPHNFS